MRADLPITEATLGSLSSSGTCIKPLWGGDDLTKDSPHFGAIESSMKIRKMGNPDHPTASWKLSGTLRVYLR
ncbi:hypothetical protein [Leptospirillum ferrooxidans]|uniref:hypothetical protein n=1 Tax=Leptospirillum ferrooxidans TaxID=180 RepID=UPI0002F328D7|nr:hypothetical protein [Leptospirillum ferrooxidans]